jgi:hypothetical protein
VRRGLLHNDIEADVLDGRSVTVAGRRRRPLNFGSCPYLGPETDPCASGRDARSAGRTWRRGQSVPVPPVPVPLSRVRSSSLAVRRARLRAASASVNRSRTGCIRK